MKEAWGYVVTSLGDCIFSGEQVRGLEYGRKNVCGLEVTRGPN